MNTIHSITALTLGMIVVASSVAYVAKAADPGDTLYPVKVGVNENISAVLTIDMAAKAELDARHFAERLEEYEHMAADGLLSTDLEQELRERAGQQFAVAF